MKDSDKNTDTNKHFLKSLERVLAGRRPGRAVGAGDARLLDLAAELSQSRPEPSEKAMSRMDARIAGLTGMAAGAISGSIDGSPAAAPQARSARWLPSWLTLPRAAAVLAVLVVGLGAVGLTRALIMGGYQGASSQPSLSATPQSATPGAAGEERAGGYQAPGSNEVLKDVAGGGAGADSATGVVAGPAGGIAYGPAGAGGTSVLPSTQRVMQSATYTIEVPKGDFQTGYDRVTALAARYGGFVVSAETRKSGEDEPLSGTITVRVNTAQDGFSRALAELDGIGTVMSRDISGQDVTEEYVDLESRLRNAQAQEAQLLALMQKAETIDEILLVQSRLAEVQSEIEQIKGRINYIQSRTDFATITVALRETGATEPPEDQDGTKWGFVESLVYAGWLAVQSVNFVILALGIIIPLAVITGLALLIGRLVWRRRTR